MTVKMSGTFLGGKKIKVSHEDSGAYIVTDAPKDNAGDGSSFSPTDLVAAAFGSCVLTTIVLVAEREGVDLSGASFRVEKQMSSMPRRIQELPLTVALPKILTAEQKNRYERVGKTCPVHHSLHPNIKAEINFEYF